MVMHARKPQRISDGYFEKHQTHPYQKYSNSKNDRRDAGEYVTSESRYIPLLSPNGSALLSPHTQSRHPYNHVSDEREYATSRNSYFPKSLEKEKDRDYKSSRNKYTDDVRSPREKRNKDSERETSNHERTDSEKKSRTSGMSIISVSRSIKYDKKTVSSANTTSGSEWSEHISSSGKKYYYNCISEVSQWEKPKGYPHSEWETRRISSKDTSYSSRNNRDNRSSSRSGKRESEKCSKRTTSTSERYWNSSNRKEDRHDRPRPKLSSGTHEGRDGQLLQDMDISPDRSTPISENSYGARENLSNLNISESDTVPPVVVLDNSNHTSGSLLAAALPRIVVVTPVTMSCAAPAVGVSVLPKSGGSSPTGDTCTGSSGQETPQHDAGPPTPTHSENTDPHAPPLHHDAALPKKMDCLGSYSSVVGGSIPHAPPMLTPSLVNYVRVDLSAHVTGWPADILEKQANKFTEEAYQLGCLQCTRVSAELKCSRSLVRHKEIQATLQEQKIMYLRQQILRLEELKTQNSFMSED